ncbi:MAG: carboxypeptidase regulatory-like domain-containing protein [Myxococcales bacterium]|nr:carboxypeptidase regulatory-like domain-containing protein [Myxococcales bacterium]
MKKRLVCWSAALALAAGCSSNECRLEDPASCPAEQICEQVQGREKPMCFAPVQIDGKVFDLATSAGIEKAEVTALDANGSPVGTVSISGPSGAYSIRVPSLRTDEKGGFAGKKVTLRAAASGYAPFPSGVRVALPLDTGAAAKSGEGKPHVLSGPLSEIGLISLPDVETGRPSISGTVEISPTQRGVLVVAEAAGAPGVSAVADGKGAFRIFNVAPGAYKVQAYSRGSNYTGADVTVVAGKDSTGVEIKKSTAPTATLTGTIQLVAGANGAGTSVVMVVESTFNANLVRGEMPPGLRAPEPGVAPNITGAFSIDGVPDGRYVVLAAFENDGNVRDPDPKIAGTQIQHLQVQGGAASAQPQFKVTGAISMVSPGAGESVEGVSGTPTFTWKPYSSAQGYEIAVFDSFGNKLWERTDVPDVKDSSGNVAVAYAGPPLGQGRVYQWKASARGNLQNLISLTEDLRGVFLAK